MRPVDLERSRLAFAAAFALAAGYHVIAAVRPAFAPSSSAGRHLVFVAIDLGFAFGFLRPPRGFVVPVALLGVQQLASHGAYALHVWSVEHRIDWVSVVVMLAIPVAIAVVALDAKSRSETMESAARK